MCIHVSGLCTGLFGFCQLPLTCGQALAERTEKHTGFSYPNLKEMFLETSAAEWV